MYEISNKNSKTKATTQNVNELAKFMNNVIAYGSADAIKIASAIQQASYKNEKSYRLLAGYSLLVAQLKFDLSGILISPTNYFEIRVTDYNKFKDEIIKEINQLIDELKLNKKFRIKE